MLIEISRTDSGIAVLGHAEYAEPGKDIVCAAVSALFQSFVASVEELTDDKIKSVIGANKALIRYNKNLSEQGQLLEDSFFLGVQMIAEAYPQNVRIVQAVEDKKATGKTRSETFKNSEGIT